jgi:hypothetical protein
LEVFNNTFDALKRLDHLLVVAATLHWGSGLNVFTHHSVEMELSFLKNFSLYQGGVFGQKLGISEVFLLTPVQTIKLLLLFDHLIIFNSV